MIVARKHVTCLLAAAFVTGTVVLMDVCADEEDEFLRVKQAYNFATWAGKTKSQYNSLASASENVRIANIPNTVKVELLRDGAPGYGGVPNWWYLLSLKDETKNTPVTVTLRVSEGKSAMDAHHAMISYLDGVSAKRLRSAKSVGLSIGDVCFVGWGETISSVAFCRNNMFVWVQSHESTYNIVTLAKFVDEAIKKASVQQGEPKDIQGGAQVNQSRNWTWLVGAAVAATVLVIVIILLLRRTRRRRAGTDTGK